MAGRRDFAETFQRPARELHAGFAAGEIDHSHVAPEDAAAQARAERLRACLLGREALGVGGGALRALIGFLAFDRRKDPAEEALAKALDALVDPAYVDQIGAQTDDHFAARR